MASSAAGRMHRERAGATTSNLQLVLSGTRFLEAAVVQPPAHGARDNTHHNQEEAKDVEHAEQVAGRAEQLAER